MQDDASLCKGGMPPAVQGQGYSMKRGAFAALSANTERLLCLAAILPPARCLTEKPLPVLSISTSTQHHQHHRQALRVQLTCARASPPSSIAAPNDIRYTHHTLSSPTRHSTPNAATLTYNLKLNNIMPSLSALTALASLAFSSVSVARPIPYVLSSGQTRARFTRTYGSRLYTVTPSPCSDVPSTMPMTVSLSSRTRTPRKSTATTSSLTSKYYSGS